MPVEHLAQNLIGLSKCLGKNINQILDKNKNKLHIKSGDSRGFNESDKALSEK